jgi:hypothetical protein
VKATRDASLPHFLAKWKYTTAIFMQLITTPFMLNPPAVCATSENTCIQIRAAVLCKSIYQNISFAFLGCDF